MRRISTQYALLFAVALLSLTLTVLALATWFAYHGSDRLRAELSESFSSVRASNDIHALKASGRYLGRRLFNHLYNLDITGLNAEVEQIRTWLDPRSVLILDAEQRVLSDGSAENPRYRERITLPDGLSADRPVVEDAPGAKVLHLVIASGDQRAGYARIELSDARNRTLLETLQNKVDQAWHRYQRSSLTIAIVGLAATLVLSIALGSRLSASLSRPLKAMTRAAERFAAGDLGHRLDSGSNNELGRLARSLNSMAGELQRADKLLARAQEMAAFGNWEYRPADRSLRLSHGVYRVLGVEPGAIEPTVAQLLSLVVDGDLERIEAILSGNLPEEADTDAEFGIIRGDGEQRVLYLKGEPLQDTAGHGISAVGTLQDISAQRRSEQELAALANADHLTGLANRNRFYDRLRHAIARAKRDGCNVALLFLDLDRFKAINDALGHDVGDELLRRVARRLEKVVRESDTLARMGGDEFTVVVENVDDDLAPRIIAQHIITSLTAAFRIADRELFISASIGIALYPRDADDIDSLIKNADTAMYAAKEQGRSTFRFFTLDLDQQAHRRLVLEQELRGAIERKEFRLCFHPQMNADSRELVAIEALLRWPQQDKVRTPDQFVAVLEETGLITRITGWALREACRSLKQLHEAGIPGLRVAVNLSARQFQQPDLIELVDACIDEFSLTGEQLELEITESTLVDRDVSARNATELAKRQVRLAIDDFGTGYSSLSYLKNFHVDLLKVDRSFVQDIAADAEDAQITATVAALAKGLGIECVAEGVENHEQLRMLQGFGCDLVQGYLLCRPSALDELTRWFHSQRPADGRYFWTG